MDDLLFFDFPQMIELCTNRFINVPVVLKYDDTPLISVTQTKKAGFATEFAIYNSDGVYIAKVKGSLTEDGKKSNFLLRQPPNMTVCELGGQTLFEIHRDKAAAQVSGFGTMDPSQLDALDEKRGSHLDL